MKKLIYVAMTAIHKGSSDNYDENELGRYETQGEAEASIDREVERFEHDALFEDRRMALRSQLRLEAWVQTEEVKDEDEEETEVGGDPNIVYYHKTKTESEIVKDSRKGEEE
jgi:hypothetical protein